jgi:hypothetical protein
MGKATPPTETEVVQRAARAAARRLAEEHGPRIETDVEAALNARNTSESPPEQYFDPISLGALIVSAATLAWTIYKDLREQGSRAAREVVARRVRLELPANENVSKADRDRVIEMVVDDITTQPDS